MGAIHTVFGVFLIGCTGGTFVECHHDVGTNLTLDLHHVLRREEEFAAVDMAGKLHALFFHLADSGKRKHLIAARVGKNRTSPALELMQSAGLLQDLRAGTKIQVIGVA